MEIVCLLTSVNMKAIGTCFIRLLLYLDVNLLSFTFTAVSTKVLTVNIDPTLHADHCNTKIGS